jgi:hypothetical protein
VTLYIIPKQYKKGSPPKPYQCPDLPETDWAYVAGIIDGEGCLSWWTTPRHDHSYPRLSVGNTNRNLTDWLQMVFGGCVGYQPRREKTNQSPLWEWKLSSEAAVYAILAKCIPYLIIKRDKALELMAHTEARGIHKDGGVS